jgi:hypothetical protein
MLKRYALSAFSLFIFTAASFAQSFNLGTVSYGTLPHTGVQAPATPPAVNIAVYSTDEEFSFESQAKPAMEARINVLKAAGLTTLGGRVVEMGNDYSFVIEYLPTVKGNTALPPAVLVETYNNGATYWIAREAEEAMKACAANFRSARLAVLDSYVYDAGSDNAFAVNYLVKNMLRPTQEYDVKFEKYTGGKYTFESQAAKAVPSYLALLKQAGVPAIRGKAVQRQDGDYSVEVEYVVKTNRYGRRPQYSVSRYDARETFSFEKDALAASKAAMPKFTAAGAPPLSSVVRPEGRDYSYGVDFLVGNIYQSGGTVPSVAVQTYQSAETFTFESEAKKALAEKIAAFGAAGLPVVGSAVSGQIRDYTYTIDYMAKAGQSGPVYPPPYQR